MTLRDYRLRAAACTWDRAQLQAATAGEGPRRLAWLARQRAHQVVRAKHAARGVQVRPKTAGQLTTQSAIKEPHRMTLTTGEAYDVAHLPRLIGWVPGDGSPVEGYNVYDFFDAAGRYLGPDRHGIEPEFEGDDEPTNGAR